MKVGDRKVGLIGFAGRKGSGKDLAAKLMIEEFGGSRVAFADELKECCGRIWNLTHEQLHGGLKEVVDDRWGLTPREIMQRFGTEVARSIHPDTWIKNVIEVQIPSKVAFFGDRATRFYISDVRFPNECAAIQAAGGHVIRIERPASSTLAYSDHPSETEIDDLPVDAMVLNNGSIRELRASLGDLIELRGWL